MLSPEEQVDLTHTQQMVALAEEVQALFPFAYVKTISGLDGMLYNFVAVYYGDNCILTIDRSKLADVRIFMDAYAYSIVANNTTQKGTEQHGN